MIKPRLIESVSLLPAGTLFTYVYLPFYPDCCCYPFQVSAYDAAGNVSVQVVTVTLDSTPPVGWVSINDDAEFTNRYEVTLALDATDAHTVTHVQLCCPEEGWEPFVLTTTAWTLPGGDGLREAQARYRDAAQNESEWTTDGITVDTQAPLANIYGIVEDSPYAYASPSVDDLVYYGVQAGDFTVQVAAEDGLSRLERAEFPPVTSAGGVYTTALAGGFQYQHAYAFEEGVDEEGVYEVSVYDRATNPVTITFSVWRDALPPTSTLSAPDYDNGSFIPVTWSADDPSTGSGQAGSGLAETRLWYRLDEGDWTDSGQASGLSGSTFYFYPPGGANGVYDFATVATDHVSNTDPLATDGKDSTVYDTIVPDVSLSLSETDPYAHVDGDTVYYGPADGGSFTVTAQADDATAGLDTIVFPYTMSPGKTYPQEGAHEATQSHVYTFDWEGGFQGDATVEVSDRAGNGNQATFHAIFDIVSPIVTLDARVEDDAIVVTWSAGDSSAGLDTCTLEVQETGGTWVELASEASGTYIYTTATPGHLHSFRLTATDNVGNEARAEAQAGIPRVTKYYYHAGQRVAMRRSTASGSVVYYLHGDHLGSTSLATCGSQDCGGGKGSGEVVSRQLYYPYGEVRYTEGTLPTDLTFTGQRDMPGLGLMHYGARFYDPYINRFISADSIVPEPGNPQDLNRYAYVRNNPIKYTDPSGHIAVGEYGDAMNIIEQLRNDYGVYVEVDFGWQSVMHPAPGEPGEIWIEGAWRIVGELQALLETVQRFETRAGSVEAVRKAIGGATIRRISQGLTAHWGHGLITIADYSFNQIGGSLKEYWGPRVAIAHELAHYWDWKTGSFWSKIFGGSGATVGGMPAAIGGELGPTWHARTAGITEDWAESVASYLFPEYSRFLREEDRAGRANEVAEVRHPLGFRQRLPGLGPFHRAHVAAQFRALSVSTP